ncbi:MAG: serine--tRNA ligase [Parcubacteria group bacterium]|nr:serine--tRNA ligase [Parcubacteria group bacterium]
MIDRTYLCEHPEEVRAAFAKRGISPDIETLCSLAAELRQLQRELDEARAKQKSVSKDTRRVTDETKALKERVRTIEKDLSRRRDALETALRILPNIPLEETPTGATERDNVVVREWKPTRSLPSFRVRDYLTVAQEKGWIDMARAAKVSGSRFGYLAREAVLWEFALVRFALDTLAKRGFIPILPPVIVQSGMMEGMGYIDSDEDRRERYYLESDKQYLVGTSEQAVVPMHAGETFSPERLPVRYSAFSSCFRREAGSYGKDTHGILRTHQFDKVEMISFAEPEKSHDEHEYLLSCAEYLVQMLEIPYRVVRICGGDLSHPAAASYDIECWMPSENRYRETHSISNTTDYQARRLNIRYRAKDGKPKLVHIVNGTAFAIGRILIALIENHQTESGDVELPQALAQYL